jgi:hypothetical protein
VRNIGHSRKEVKLGFGFVFRVLGILVFLVIRIVWGFRLGVQRDNLVGIRLAVACV